MCYFSAPTVDHSCGVRLLTRLPPDAPLARCTNNRFGTCCKRRISPACCRKGREHRELHCRRCQNNELHSTEGNGMNRNPYAPIIKDDIFMCWERDQHEGAAIYEYHQTLHWSGSFGAYTDYSVTGTSTIAATKGKVKIELAGTFPNPGLEHYSSRSIVLTSTDGTVTEIRCHDSGSPSEGSTASEGTQVDGVNFLYDNNPQNLATNISKSIGFENISDIENFKKIRLLKDNF